MAEKMYTIILKVDLECDRCYKKIKRTICKLQERESIRTIAYDEKNNTVTISGPFDPKKLSKKLCCKACNVIKDIQIVEPKEKEKEKEKPKEKEEKSKDTKPAEKEKSKDTKPAEKEKEKEKEKDSKPTEQAKPKEKEKEKGTDEPKLTVTHTPGPAYPPGYAIGPVCSCGPWYEAHYGGCRCFACGRTYGWVSEGPPHDGNRTCHFFSDEDPTASCSVM